MSWDVLIMRFGDFKNMDDIPNDWNPPVIGSKSELIQQLKKAVPTADFTDESWVMLDGDGYSIEISIGKDDPVDSIMLHVRGSNEAMKAIFRILEETQLRALDTSTSEFLNSVDQTEGFNSWRDFRDRVIINVNSKNDDK